MRDDTAKLLDSIDEVIHDISNPLLVILGNISIVKRCIKDSGDIASALKCLTDAEAAAFELDALVKQLAYLRRNSLTHDEVE